MLVVVIILTQQGSASDRIIFKISYYKRFDLFAHLEDLPLRIIDHNLVIFGVAHLNLKIFNVLLVAEVTQVQYNFYFIG